jgi:hypothetical protein
MFENVAGTVAGIFTLTYAGIKSNSFQKITIAQPVREL